MKNRCRLSLQDQKCAILASAKKCTASNVPVRCILTIVNSLGSVYDMPDVSKAAIIFCSVVIIPGYVQIISIKLSRAIVIPNNTLIYIITHFLNSRLNFIFLGLK